MANNQKLYNMFSQYSDEQLQQVLQARNYNQNAKSIAYDILMQRNPNAYPAPEAAPAQTYGVPAASPYDNQYAEAPAAPVASPFDNNYAEAPAAPVASPYDNTYAEAPAAPVASPFDNPYTETLAAPAAPAGPIDFPVNPPTYAAPPVPDAPVAPAPQAPAYGAPAAPAYPAPAAPVNYPVNPAYNAQKSKLYRKFCIYSDMQLQQILMARNYSQEAKMVANSILHERSGGSQPAEAPANQGFSSPVYGTPAVPGAPADSAAVNNAAAEPAANTGLRAPAHEVVQKYRELLEMGAITQEEFEAKKKQFLGL